MPHLILSKEAAATRGYCCYGFVRVSAVYWSGVNFIWRKVQYRVFGYRKRISSYVNRVSSEYRRYPVGSLEILYRNLTYPEQLQRPKSPWIRLFWARLWIRVSWDSFVTCEVTIVVRQKWASPHFHETYSAPGLMSKRVIFLDISYSHVS
jgi:hypothetical protein